MSAGNTAANRELARQVGMEAAIENLPGVGSITQSFAVILLLAFIVVVLVTWVFFLILTVQKTSSLTLLRAVGASTWFLLANQQIIPQYLSFTGMTMVSSPTFRLN